MHLIPSCLASLSYSSIAHASIVHLSPIMHFRRALGCIMSLLRTSIAYLVASCIDFIVHLPCCATEAREAHQRYVHAKGIHLTMERRHAKARKARQRNSPHDGGKARQRASSSPQWRKGTLKKSSSRWREGAPMQGRNAKESTSRWREDAHSRKARTQGRAHTQGRASQRVKARQRLHLTMKGRCAKGKTRDDLHFIQLLRMHFGWPWR